MRDTDAKVVNEATRLLLSMECDAVFIMRHGDTITIRDNSGKEGLMSDVEMDRVQELMDHLFGSLT